MPATSDTEAEIREALTALHGAIKAADGQKVAAELARLDGLLDTAGGALHPQLRHYLEGRSYAKALAFLGGATDIPAGACGGRKA